MKALYFEEHGERDVLQYGDLPDIENKENHVLIDGFFAAKLRKND